jgi:transcriptional regulator NrdR family protein
MLCPTCHGPSRILETRLTGPDLSRKRRRHQCCDEACRHRFTTLELEDSPRLRAFLAGGAANLSPRLRWRLAMERAKHRLQASIE